MAAHEKIYVGSDHAGFALKEALAAALREWGYAVEDLGTHSTDSTDYPDYAAAVAQRVAHEPGARGVLACATGIGMSISANKVPGVRAALVCSEETARLARAHNDSNVLCLPGKLMATETAQRVLRLWLDTPFDGGRHERRVNKIRALDEGAPAPAR